MEELRKLNIKLTKEDVRESFSADVLIIQVIHTVDELVKVVNRLVENLRERYGYYAPKQSKVEDVSKFFSNVKKLKKEEMGGNFSKKDLDTIVEVVRSVEGLVKVLDSQEKYLEGLMEKHCKNLFQAVNYLIGARLLSLAGGLKNLAKMPSSTVQMLGAEKALFRHLRKGAKPPKFGIIFSEVIGSKEKGKAARRLAAKIALAARKDYYGNK